METFAYSRTPQYSIVALTVYSVVRNAQSWMSCRCVNSHMIAARTLQLAAQIGPIEAAILENSGIGSIGPGLIMGSAET
jgi:hypothetical protein